LQLSTKVVTQLGQDPQRKDICLHGLAGFTREVVALYHKEVCPTCAANAATKKSKRPAAHAIRTSGPFRLGQVRGMFNTLQE
jgi:hypothetical protein